MKICKKILFAVLCACAGFFASAAEDYTVEAGVVTLDVKKLGNDKALEVLKKALDDSDVLKIILTDTIKLSGMHYISSDSESPRKIIQVEKPFLPESGKVLLTASVDGGELDTIYSPAENEYSKYKIFEIQEKARVTISNLTLMGGFTGLRTVDGDSTSTGGIDNKGFLEMYSTDITRTGTALLNQPGATAVLVDCNIVRNANWYGGGILNFADYDSSAPEGSKYSNGGTLIMDRCSLTENESLGPSHGGGAAENQGLMCLNNCVIANNASTEIGGGINNCKGGDLYVMNCTFTGNITTSDEYGTTAGGAIGNAGGAGNVYIVNSILAYNGYDYGEDVNWSSIGRYKGSSGEHYCHLANSVIDAVAGMDRMDATNTTTRFEGLFNGYSESGIVAAGGNHVDNGVMKSSGFTHPLVPLPPGETIATSYRYAQEMASVETNHYIFTLSVPTYFDYSGIIADTTTKPYMGYHNGEEIVALGGKDEQGNDHTMLLPDKTMIVDVTFSKEKRDPYNPIGAVTVEPKIDEEAPTPPGVFEVRLGSFTGGQVSGVTIYGDSYISNSLVTVHASANSAYYLNGWMINGEVVPRTAQQYIFTFSVWTNITLTPLFQPVVTQIYRARQRYPWNNLVDIDYSVAETNAVKYRLVFLATYEENGKTNTIQLRTFRRNDDTSQTQRLGDRWDLHRAGDHRVTWDSAADGVELKGKKVHYRALACEGNER